MHLRRIRRAADVPARAWWVWGAAASFYLLALFHRMGLGVASLEASERLDLPVDTIAMLSALQLGLYLALVVPAGLAADRIGPRMTLAGGMTLMALGEIAFGFAQSAPLALGGRALVGIGDAFIFLSVLRVAQNWFPARRYAMLALLTATAGALGQLMATIPLGTALEVFGWEPVFVGSGLLAAAAAVVCVIFVRDHPVTATATAGDDPAAPRRGAGAGARPGIGIGIGRSIVLAFGARGTRRGFWTHFGLMGPFVAVTALWGYPYLVRGLGMAEEPARAWLLATVVACAVSSPLIGILVAHAPDTRVPLTIAITGTVGALWAAALLWPGGPPLAVPLTALVLTGVTCSAAMLAFDFAREDNPPERVGTATGLVNLGGFSAAVLIQLTVGWMLRASGGDYALALLPVPVLMAIACIQMVRHARAARTPAPAVSPVAYDPAS